MHDDPLSVDIVTVLRQGPTFARDLAHAVGAPLREVGEAVDGLVFAGQVYVAADGAGSNRLLALTPTGERT